MRLSSLVALFVLVSLGTPSAGWAKGKSSRLVGSWVVVKWIKSDKEGTPPPGVEVKMSFKKDHTWRGQLVLKGETKKSETGTWTLEGDKLVTRSKKKPNGEAVRVKFEGSSMRLRKEGTSDVLVFKRVE